MYIFFNLIQGCIVISCFRIAICDGMITSPTSFTKIIGCFNIFTIPISLKCTDKAMIMILTVFFTPTSATVIKIRNCDPSFP